MNSQERINFIEILCETVKNDIAGHDMSSLNDAPQFKNCEGNSRSNCTDCTYKRDRAAEVVGAAKKKPAISAQYCIQCSALNWPEVYIVCVQCLQGHPQKIAKY